MSSLATRCPECGTVFRVVPDQLRVSEGWVRCGRCTAVFNAVENFVELETRPAGPAPQPPKVPERTPAAHAAAAAAADPPASSAIGAAGGVEDSTVEPTLDHPHSAFHRYDDEDRGDDADDGIRVALGAPPPSSTDPQIEPDARTAPLPSFVRQADRAARWRSRPVRIASGVALVLLATGLAAQVAHTWRDHLAARLPALQPALAAACGVLDCTLGPARSIGALAVEGSGLGRVERSSLYKLSLTLKNRADIALAIPALDLSLTDSDGKRVARRVLTTAELGLAAPGSAAIIAAGQDLPLQAVLQLDRAAPAVTGYTVELFYP